MTKPSMTDLERQETGLLAALVGETPGSEKLSAYDRAREQVRLLTLLAGAGLGNGNGPAFAEAYGPTADRPTGVGPGFQYFDTDAMALLISNGSEWAEFNSGPHTAIIPGDRPTFIQEAQPTFVGSYFWVKLLPGGGAEFYYEDGV